MAFASSMGFGHGAFGHGPCGHGPWVTFPFTPGYPFDVVHAAVATAHRFDDQTEHCVTHADRLGRTLTYALAYPSSQDILALQSWWAEARGPATRFVALDHQAKTPQVVRLAGDTAAVDRRASVVHGAPPLTFVRERHVTYGEILHDQAPEFWWRLDEPTGATSLHDTGRGWLTIVTSQHALITRGASLGLPGLLTDDHTTAMDCTSAIVTHSLAIIDQGIRIVSAVVQPTWPPRTGFRPQVLYSVCGSNGLHLALRIDSNGYLQGVTSQGVVITASAVPLTGNRPYHVALASSDFLGIVSVLTLYVDGEFQVGGNSGLLTLKVVTSGSIGGLPNSSHYFDGRMQDVAVWWSGPDVTDPAIAERFALQARVALEP